MARDGLAPLASEVLQFWFAGVGDDPLALEERAKLWFGADAEFDRVIEARFADAVHAAGAGKLDGWSHLPRGRLALVLLLDQFTRNLHRGRREAFANDAAALRLCRAGMERGHDSALDLLERGFFYLPLQHAEEPGAQAISVAMSEALVREATPALRPYFERSLRFAREHHDIVARFGRFPHRNHAMQRTTTGAERAYLDDGAPTFGQ